MGKPKKSIFALIGIAIICTIAISAIIAELTNDDILSVNTITQSTILENNATYLVTITNIGNETDTFILTAINMDNASVASLNQSEIALDAGHSGMVVLNVTDELITGPYCVRVNATSQTTGLTDEVETITAIVEDWEE
jgi:hypothetical protein